MARIGWGRHSTVATGTDSGDQVSVNAWNANLATSGILGFTKQSASISSNNITPTDSLIEVQATGTLNTLTPTDNNEFDLIYLIAASGATVTITHDGTGGAGKIRLLSAINKTLSTTVPTILMCRTISGNKEWVEYGGGAINSIDDINDVVITSATPSQVLTYDGTNWINQFPTIVGQFVRNSSGSPIAKGKAVYVSGYDVGTGYPEISLADNSSSSTMSALGITNESIGNNATGFVIINGKLSDIDTSTFLVNATVYVGTSGSLTTTKPTGTALIQNVGKVLRSHASNGQIEVISIGRTNDIPNIAQDNVWVGNASGVPTATATTGSGNVVRATSATLTTPTIGAATATTINKVAITAPTTSATLTIADGKTLTASNSLTLTGTDLSSVAFGTGGTVLYSGGALGTPSSGTLSGCSGLPISTGVSGLGSGIATFLATPTSANLISAVTDETGSGALVFGTSPTLTTPRIGTIADTSGNSGIIITPTASAVNQVTITNAAATTSPIISASGNDTNIDVNIRPKGTGVISIVPSGNTAYDGVKILPRAGGTGSYSATITPTTLTASRTLTLPDVTGTVLATTLTSTAQGDILYYNGTAWVNLAAGTSGQYLKTQGASANPTWASVSTSAPVTSDLQLGTTGCTTPSYTTRNNNDASTPIQFWVQDIDTNNQAVYARIKKNGSYVNVQIA